MAEVFLNGPMRAVRNLERVGADGSRPLYRQHMLVCVKWARTRQFGWYRRSFKAFVPLGTEAFYFYRILQNLTEKFQLFVSCFGKEGEYVSEI